MDKGIGGWMSVDLTDDNDIHHTHYTTPLYVGAVLLLLLGTTHIFHSALGKRVVRICVYASLSCVIQLKCVNISVFKIIFHF
jgi:hypothetical protein